MIGSRRRLAAAVAAASLLLATVSAAQAAGAFAVGACGAYGYAYDYKQMAAARTAAAQKCSGMSCKIVGAIRRGSSPVSRLLTDRRRGHRHRALDRSRAAGCRALPALLG